MNERALRDASRLLLFVSCISLIVVGPVVGHPDPDDHEEEGNGLTDNETARLWSLDSDQFVSESTLNNISDGGSNRTLEQALWNGTDYIHQLPPRTPITWNRHDHHDFPANLTTSYWHPLPEEADITAVKNVPLLNAKEKDRSVGIPGSEFEEGDRGWIQDAHATMFALQPSTHLLKGPDETVQYIDPEGEVLGTVDYRVRVPGPDSLGSDRRAIFKLQRHEIESTCVVQGGDPDREDICSSEYVIGTGDGSHTPTINFSASGRAGSQQRISFAAEVRVTMLKEIQEWQEQENGPGFWETVQENHIDSEKVVSDTEEVTVYNTPRATAYAFEFPSQRQKMGVSFAAQMPWAGIDLPGETRINTLYRFYTARDDTWDTLRIKGQGNENIINSSLHPARTYAFPYKGGPDVDPSPINVSIIDTIGRAEYQSPSPAIPENVSVSPVPKDTNYTQPQTVVARVNSYDPSEIRALGLVHGINLSNDDLPVERKANVTRPEIETELLEFNNSHALFAVTVTDASGDPIRTAGTDAYLEYMGEQYDTNASGQAVIRTPSSTNPRITYVPADWWATDDPQLSASTDAPARSSISTADGIAGIISRVIMLAIPFLLTFWLMDKVPGISTWPPREILKR
ncbi:hypothetical protein SAMN05216388_100910 [Halorientalis persicus]|uniref:Uncharacterized protein n=1 Tax=Halorientalis persicus TaxID=1367881 RepID=A0A1H8MIA4_9EURY|nr:hypothetical protein SAMN05216388_100910 [Halorientalis persicus]